MEGSTVLENGFLRVEQFWLITVFRVWSCKWEVEVECREKLIPVPRALPVYVSCSLVLVISTNFYLQKYLDLENKLNGPNGIFIILILIE